jgi:hypothetical protein
MLALFRRLHNAAFRCAEPEPDGEPQGAQLLTTVIDWRGPHRGTGPMRTELLKVEAAGARRSARRWRGLFAQGQWCGRSSSAAKPLSSYRR